MSSYPHRYFVIASAAAVPATRQLFRIMGGTDADGNVLHARLSANGEEPATHFAASTQATEEHREQLEVIEAQGGLPLGLSYFRCDEATRELQRTNCEAAQLRLWQPYTFDDALAALGLFRIGGDE